MRRLNVGCGSHHKEGWHNIDIRTFPGVDEVRDATLPFDDLTPIKYIYSEHFLEHLNLNSAISFLRNSAAALDPLGRIRISTPALEWVLATHFDLKGDREDEVVQTLATNRAFHGWGHQFIWSKAMLQAALGAVGLQEIGFWMYGESNDPALVGLERHGDFVINQGWPSVWIVEGTRGPEITEDETFFRLCEDHFHCYMRGGY
jgi:hypothetical protein